MSTQSLLRPPLVEGAPPTHALAAAEEYLSRHEVDSPRRTAEILLMHVLGIDRIGLFVRRQSVTRQEGERLAKALSDRARDVPLQYVVGRQQFMDLDLQMRPGVFIPRPETEALVEAAVQVLRAGPAEPFVVDVGTGSGAIALAVKRFFPRARVVGTDVSEAAVEVAQTNADRLGLDVGILQGDLLDPLPTELRGRVDLLVSNPPYVTPEEYDSLSEDVKAEPYEALVGGMAFHRALVDAAVEWLSPGGWLITEIGADQGDDVRKLFARRLASVEILTDLASRDRIVIGSPKKVP